MGAADLEARLRAARDEIASLAGDVDAAARAGDAADRQVQRQLKGVAAQERRCREPQSLVDEVRTGLAELQADMTSRMPLPRLHRLVAQLLLRLGAAPPGVHSDAPALKLKLAALGFIVLLFELASRTFALASRSALLQCCK